MKTFSKYKTNQTPFSYEMKKDSISKKDASSNIDKLSG